MPYARACLNSGCALAVLHCTLIVIISVYFYTSHTHLDVLTSFLLCIANLFAFRFLNCSVDTQLRKLHASLESLVAQRRDLVTNTAQFAKSCALLSNAEEHTGLSRALSHLAEVEEKVEQVHVEQANGDFFQLSETIRDYVALLGAVKVRLCATLLRLCLNGVLSSCDYTVFVRP